ncbi:tyrosine-type recombinase/integrase [Haloarcula onubensis]|uniref:Tyrosine-type recombinase/integrase n=1 Tax=Haloarcula onubensis TaxID=2950539 RepID=A0ABU2FKP3_9EURY|nr:tyrosine-type recombinase/integrase [Halomicroarcula sp. S3CR25-11]MDS0280931.1 tyrosine-type recombinase/integrase [Halomicroarcula sp. S3CR25-11]
MTKELEPLTPSEAKEMFLADRRGQVSERTVQADDYRLRHLIRWAEDNGLDNLNELDGRTLHKFRLWRKEDGDLNKVSLRTQLKSLRVFIKWCESIDAVEEGLHEKILLPTPSKEEERREETLRSGQAENVLEYLRRFEYASRSHTLVELLWHTGLRIGAVYSLDIEDFDSEEQRLSLTHRPDTETPLKNKSEGERMVALSQYLCEVLEDWIDHNRPEVTDENDREPLFASEQGRLTISTMRERVYTVTRPCYYGDHCPHDRRERDCEATKYGYRSKCPSSVSPHSIRRGAITHFLTEDVPEKVVSDRMDVGQDVLDKHYDRRTEEVKVEQRRGYLDGI